MSSIETKLRSQVQGDVFCDDLTRWVYSRDASIYRVLPRAVVAPRNTLDVQAAIGLAGQQGLSIIPRGAATGTTGGCLGEGIVLDVSRYLNRILEIDPEQKFAWVEPGVVQDDLNQALERYGLRLGPDTSTGNRATLGGMLANNAAGAHSMRYGKMSDHILCVEICLANGEKVLLQEMDEQALRQRLSVPDSLQPFFNQVQTIREKHRELVRQAFPPLPRRVSGYLLDSLITPGNVNPARIIAGSEGTLGVITRLKVRLAPRPATRGLCLICFSQLAEALKAVPILIRRKPLALELIDRPIIEQGRSHPMMRGRMDWLSGTPEALLILEMDAADNTALLNALEQTRHFATKEHLGDSIHCISDSRLMRHVWDLRKAGLGLLQSRRTHSQATAFMEDIAIAPELLPEVIPAFKEILDTHNKTASFYGHAGDGCLHVRPMLDLRSNEDRHAMIAIMEAVTSLLKKTGGVPSGEHGDGLIRSWLNPRVYDPAIVSLFDDLKFSLDPHNYLNPGKIVHAADPLSLLKVDQDSWPAGLPTFFHFEKEGGLPFAAALCNGNGACRSRDRALMCPSFQGTLDERYTTRARAQGLSWLLQNGWDASRMRDPALYDVLDLCLQCKGCKTECPAQVDMAKMKSEYLFHFYQRKHFPLRSRLFGNLDKALTLAARAPAVANWLAESFPARALWRFLRLAPSRKPPRLAACRLEKLLHRSSAQPDPGSLQGPPVVLLRDTFSEFHEPEIFLSARRVLWHFGFPVTVPPYLCCGRPLLSKGMLIQAKKYAARLTGQLEQFARKRYGIIGLEPSCLYTLKDDYPDLLNTEAVDLIASHCFTLESWLVKNGVRLPAADVSAKNLAFHGHCYQKSLEGTAALRQALDGAGGSPAMELDAGCCGMAGSFGYETEHYDLSMKIGESRLFPAIRELELNTPLIANGFSCRCQIKDGTGAQAKHIALLLDECIQKQGNMK